MSHLWGGGAKKNLIVKGHLLGEGETSPLHSISPLKVGTFRLDREEGEK